MKVLIHPDYEALRDFLLQLPNRMDSEGTYIYGGRRNLIKSFVAPDGTVLNVKRYHAPHGINSLAYSLGLRQPKGLRAWTYPSILNAKGIETPQAVAYIEYRHCGLIGLSYFISLQCPYRHRLYEVSEAQPELYEPLALALARFTAHMHQQEVYHCDYSPGNILWDRDDDGTFRFSIVDINRMRFGAVSEQLGCECFRRLWGPKAFFRILAREYARLRGFSPDDCERKVMESRRKFWTHYAKHHDISFPLEL